MLRKFDGGGRREESQAAGFCFVAQRLKFKQVKAPIEYISQVTGATPRTGGSWGEFVINKCQQH